MLITMLAVGTRGDVQPYIALGVALKRAGDYTIRIAASESFESLVKGYGLEFYPLKGDVSKIGSDSRVQKAMQADNPLKIILSFNTLKSLVFDGQKDLYDACQGSDAIIYHPGAAIGYFVAQDLNIPSILASPFPMTPTQDYPALIFYDSVHLGKRFNYLTHLLFEQTMWGMSRSPIKELWKQKFGCIPPNFSNPFRQQQTKHYPTIVSCSNHVFPKPQDWPESVYNTGYWFLDEGDNWQPTNQLQDFLQSGKPPVYVGFGSVGDPTQAAETTELVIDALQRSGQRGVLATQWSGMTKLDRIPDNIFMLESAPHAWLFPRMSAVVHHGGAGTTAAGLRAGVPSILIPHANDQFAWGRRVYELGVGAKPIPRKKLTSEKLSAAITSVLTTEIQQEAKILGKKIQSENGVEVAVQVITRCLEQR
ncbi:glycosyltransferase [Capilliphycus salinus ALCB114379]|uniref:glycosyltransferase n=1 Tax=Capilliphycus salinus TaxID=2768948 RepID=UPI0039A40F0A